MSTATPAAKPATVTATPVPATASVRRAAPSAKEAATTRGSPKLSTAPATAVRSG